MKETLNTSEIADRLFRDENAGFTYAGARALAEYLDTDENADAEFDRVSIRCDFAEYSSLTDWAENYFVGDNWRDCLNCEYDADADTLDEKISEYIQDHGTLIEFDGGIIVSSF
jgi:hypothetical protein